jgi:hypothetical protein
MRGHPPPIFRPLGALAPHGAVQEGGGQRRADVGDDQGVGAPSILHRDSKRFYAALC